MQDDTEIGGPDVRFRPTLWTIVLNAREGAPAALDRLISTYWKPVYFYVRRRGHDVDDSKDLTQSFFATFLEKDFLRDVARHKGKFRSFVLAALSHLLSNEYDRARAKKRGGDVDFVRAETELVSAEPGPEAAFQKQWAVELLTRAMERLKTEHPNDVELLRGDGPTDLSVSERKNRRFRLRKRLRELLREEILPSVADEAEVESEMHQLFASLA